LDGHGLREILVVLPVLVGATVGVYGFLLPRKLEHAGAPSAALTLSIIAAVLLFPAFWSGLPLVLGAAGAVLGYAGRNAADGARRSVTAVVLGLLAALGYITIYIVETLALYGIG